MQEEIGTAKPKTTMIIGGQEIDNEIKPIELKLSPDDEDVGYLFLPDHPGSKHKNVVEKQLELRELINDYKGPDIYLDFDTEGRLIGIEVLA